MPLSSRTWIAIFASALLFAAIFGGWIAAISGPDALLSIEGVMDVVAQTIVYVLAMATFATIAHPKSARAEHHAEDTDATMTEADIDYELATEQLEEQFGAMYDVY